MGVVSGLIAGVLRIKWGHYTGFLQLDLISALFMGYMQVVCRYFMGILPFTAILQVISRPLFYKSTKNVSNNCH